MKPVEQEEQDRIALLFRTASDRKKRTLVICEGANLLLMKKFISEMNQILDPRHARLLRPEKKPRPYGLPFLYRYWLHLPPGGDLLVCEHAYYHDLIRLVLGGDINGRRRGEIVREIAAFEEDIVNDGTQLIKFHFPISPAKLRQDFEKKIAGTFREDIMKKRYRLLLESSPKYQTLFERLRLEISGRPWVSITPPRAEGLQAARRALISTMEKTLEIDSGSAVRNFDEAMNMMRASHGGSSGTS